MITDQIRSTVYLIDPGSIDPESGQAASLAADDSAAMTVSAETGIENMGKS